MRGSAPGMGFLRPRTPEEALALYAERPDAVPLAGGTDFMVSWNMGLANGKTVLDLSALAPWARVRETARSLWIGALATHARLKRDPAVRRRFPLLAQACATVGGEQIQNRGTLGGNLANASPAGDTFPALAVYGASVHLVSAPGRRTVPALELFTGVKKTCLRAGELIESVELPFPARRPARALFRKVGTRAAQAISKTVAAGLLWLDPRGRVEELRFALGSVAPTVRRLRAAEEAVRGKALAPGVVAEACALLERDISPIDDLRSTRAYRLAVSRNLLRAFLMPDARASRGRPIR